MPATLKLEIVTPGAVTFSKDVEMITLPGVDGAALAHSIARLNVKGRRRAGS